MPKYFYKCNICNAEFSIWHNMVDTKTTCPHSNCLSKEALVKIPSLTSIVINNKTKDGKKVEEFIENSKNELQEFKEELTKKREKWK